MMDPILLAGTANDADVSTTLVDSLIAQARALGLTWTLRLATAVTLTPLQVIFDGDDTPVEVTSMIGAVISGARLYIIIIPRSGNFVVGRAGGPSNRYLGANIGTAGGFPAASAGAEAAFVSASWNIAEPIFEFAPRGLYRIEAELAPTPSTATPKSCIWRIRKGQATTTGTVLAVWYVSIPAPFAGSAFSDRVFAYIRNSSFTTTISTRLSMTVQLVLGTGSAQIYGGDAGSPTFIAIKEVGTIEDSGNMSQLSGDVSI